MAIPSLLEVLARASDEWREQAACRDVDTDFFYEANSRHRDDLGLPRALEPFLVCAACPVRRECLTEAMQPFNHRVRPDVEPVAARVVGVWGGTTSKERQRVRHLPVEQAVDELEAGFPERLRIRVSAFESKHPVEGPHKHCRGGRCAPARKLLEGIRTRPTS